MRSERRLILRGWAFFIAAVVSFGICVMQPDRAFADDKADKAHAATASDKSFTSSNVCGRCHVDIFDHWRNSIHARAVEDPIFRTSYYEAYTVSGGEAKFLCLKCHAPTTQLTKDFDLKDEISREGVTCDYCHSVKSVKSAKDGYPFEVEPGQSKFGPWKDSKSTWHKSTYSPLYESATFCSGCHEYTNEHGLRILETYSEWERGPYSKEGVTCQNCHMPRVEGFKSVSIEGVPARGFVNLHQLAGGSTLGQLQRALDVEISSVERQGKDLAVEVALTNRGAGHMVPTGLPGRAVVLEVAVRVGGKEVLSQQQSYRKILLDGEGNEIEKISRLFGAEAVAQDNRIAPKETRREKFSFPVGLSKSIEVSAKVFYLYEPYLVEKKQVKVEIVRKERVAPGLD